MKCSITLQTILGSASGVIGVFKDGSLMKKLSYSTPMPSVTMESVGASGDTTLSCAENMRN